MIQSEASASAQGPAGSVRERKLVFLAAGVILFWKFGYLAFGIWAVSF